MDRPISAAKRFSQAMDAGSSMLPPAVVFTRVRTHPADASRKGDPFLYQLYSLPVFAVGDESHIALAIGSRRQLSAQGGLQSPT